MNGSGRTPMHLWVVGALATLWNAFGAFDYVMTQTHNEKYLANFTDPQRAYFDSFPRLDGGRPGRSASGACLVGAAAARARAATR